MCTFIKFYVESLLILSNIVVRETSCQNRMGFSKSIYTFNKVYVQTLLILNNIAFFPLIQSSNIILANPQWQKFSYKS